MTSTQKVEGSSRDATNLRTNSVDFADKEGGGLEGKGVKKSQNSLDVIYTEAPLLLLKGSTTVTSPESADCHNHLNAGPKKSGKWDSVGSSAELEGNLSVYFNCRERKPTAGPTLHNYQLDSRHVPYRVPCYKA